jgi:hypothetical protein
MNDLTRWLAGHKNKMDGYRALARACGVRWQQPQKWVVSGEVPARRVAAVARVTGIAAAKLNPHVAKIFDQAAAQK